MNIAVVAHNGKVVKLALSTISNGRSSGMLPIKLTSSVDTVAAVTVDSQTEKTRSGAVRMLFKVSLPYTALTGSTGSALPGDNYVDARRSNGEISAHIVVTMPKNAADDLKGAHGQHSTNAAYGQLLAVLDILQHMLGCYAENGHKVVLDNTGDTLTVHTVQAQGFLAPADIGADGTIAAIATSRKIPRSYLKTEARGANLADLGYDVTSADFASADLASDPFRRAVNGLTPVAALAQDRDGTVLPAQTLV